MDKEIRACAAPWHRGVDLLVKGVERNSDLIPVGTSVVMEDVSSNLIIQPTLTIGIDQAQTLMDDLWNAGLRPTEGTGSAGSLRATERHLADMQKLVFENRP